MTTKRIPNAELYEAMDMYAIALLRASYGDIASGSTPLEPPNPAVFNSVNQWIRTSSGLEPLGATKSGLEALGEEMKRGRTNRNR